MSSLEEIRKERLKKLETLKDKGFDPYPAKVNRTHRIAEVVLNFDNLKEVGVVGRVMSMRSFGGSIFSDLNDGSGRIQVYFKKDELEGDSFELFEGNIDVGDFIEVTGSPFTTKRGEKSLLVSSWNIVTKGLQPLPEKWHGLQDPEARFRQRYLDILLNGEIKDLFILKEKFWDSTRNFMKEEGFLEVETPTLEITTGGAEAKPFQTHHNDFDIDVYLRISIGELWQKRLMAAGFEKTFEIGRAYRNEGSSADHVQEFTNMEFYWAYADYKDGMELTKKMYRRIAQDTFGKTDFEARGHKFDLSQEWEMLDYTKEIEKHSGINIESTEEKDLKEKLNELGVKYEGDTRERMIDSLWKHIRKNIAGPAFLINHPKLISPLAKENPDNPNTVQRFQIIIAGSEIGNGYSELNNPVEQKRRFDEQRELLKKGDDTAMMPDDEFVEMLEHGMPPTCGFGFGERFFAFLVDKPIREVQLFPLMKPKGLENKSKETFSAVAIINNDAKMEKWQELNTIAHLTAAFGAREGKKLFSRDSVPTKSDRSVLMNIKHGIVIKKASSNIELQEIMALALEKGMKISEFIREMIETTNDNKISEILKNKKIENIEYLGLLVFGSRKEVEELTKDLELYK